MRIILATILIMAAPQSALADAQEAFEAAALGFWQRIVEEPKGDLDDAAIEAAYNACGKPLRIDALAERIDVLDERAMAQLPGHIAFLKPGKQLARLDLTALDGLPITQVEAVPVRANGQGWRLHAGRGSMLMMTSARTANGPTGPITQMFMMDAQGVYLRCPMSEADSPDR